ADSPARAPRIAPAQRDHSRRRSTARTSCPDGRPGHGHHVPSAVAGSHGYRVRMAPVASYTAVCERDGDWWVITVPELDAGAVTQARTLDEVPATVADLVALMTDADPATIEVR